jgi:hypothetical protein
VAWLNAPGLPERAVYHLKAAIGSNKMEMPLINKDILLQS